MSVPQRSSANKRALPSDGNFKRSFNHLSEESKIDNAGKGVGNILKANRPLPGSIDVDKFITSRAFEIYTMKRAQAQASTENTTRAFQTLPRHLRRRAASHNPRRVPGRLRTKARFEIDKGDKTIKIQKKKALRRRKSGINGLSVTDRWLTRQRDKRWLETHLWHAKRAHMITKWGYRLPLTPTAKCHRPSHRAAHNGCIIGDVSYFSVIQLEGSVRDLRGCLSGVVGGSGWAGSRYENGTRMGKTVLYRYKQWPFAMIGPVEILWQPTPTPTRSTMGTEPMKKVWIRFHPGMFEEAWESIRTGVQGWYQQGTSSYLPESGSGSGPEGNEGKRGIRMKDLRGELCVFELMGPRSVLVLKGVLGLVKDQQVGGSSEDKGEEAEGMDVEQDEQKEEKDGREKKRFWNGMKSVQSSGQLSRGMVVGLKVHDPRLRFPPSNAKHCQVSVEEEPPEPVFPSTELAESSLWDEQVRGNLVHPRFRKADLDERRRSLGLPGKKLQPMIKDDKIPIILVQRSLASETSPEDQASAIHGYTLFVPAGWAMPFWQSLVFTGSLIMGMEERATQYLEAGVPGFPECFPLTKTGGDWWVDKMDGKKKRWERRPPGKRMEYDVLKLEKPWDVCWNGVLGVEGTWIVPDWVLQGLQAGLRGGAKDMQTLFWRVLDKCSVALGLDKVPDDKRQQAWETALVHVSLTTVGRGSPKDHAEICEISDEERESLAKEEDVGELQAPSPTNDSTRVGYVLAGTQSLARGKGHAIAAVSLSRFLHIPLAVVSTGKTDARGQLIKFRNSEGLIWRYAVLRLVI